MLSKHDAPESKTNNLPLKATYEKARTYIKNNLRDGLWPYFPGQKPSTEATAWCAIAMRDDAAVAESALNALIAACNADGGWSTEPKFVPSDWTSGPALLALRVLHEQSKQTRASEKAIQKGLEYMFDSRTEFYGTFARLLLLMANGKQGLEYARGWPWSPSCFHWIEPTSYALLALKVPTLPKAGVYAEIISRANQFVIEHECKGGGWNHGSAFCLQSYLPPYIVTTAEALLALQERPDLEAVKAGLQFLEKTEPDECSAMEHAWAILALHAHNRPTKALVDSLARSQKADGSFGVNLMVTGLSVIALETAVSGRNPLNYAAQKNGHT